MKSNDVELFDAPNVSVMLSIHKRQFPTQPTAVPALTLFPL